MTAKKVKELEEEKETIKSLLPELSKEQGLSNSNDEKIKKLLNRLAEITDEIFYERHGFYNKYEINETTTVKIFSEARGDKGSYSWEYLRNFHMPILMPSMEWKCTSAFEGERCQGNLSGCDSEDNIRIKEEISGVDFNEEQLFYFMKKPRIEKVFDIKIKKIDLTDIKNLVVGFYYYENQNGNGQGISAVINTAVFVEKYKEAIIKKHGFEKWSTIDLLLKITSKN